MARTAVLLVNLGSPDAPTPAAVRRYLNQFLSDRRVIEIPPVFWQPILKGAILTTRPARSARNYARIWDRERNDSPLRVITAAQAEALQQMLGGDITVDHAMRYGRPAIADVLARLLADGHDRIVFAPLYPQYCAATTASAADALHDALRLLRSQPSIRMLPPYHSDPAYISALAESMERSLAGLGWKPEHILLSFHGMPERTRTLGDPYHDHCRMTADLLRSKTGYTEARMPVTFQSRFGRARWLEPATEPMLQRLAAAGVRDVAVMTPGFAADCVETLEEIAITAKEVFLAAGGARFHVIPSLNASPEGMGMLRKIISRELAGWEDDR